MCELVEVSVHFAATGDVHSSDAERHSEHGEQSDDEECHPCFCHAPTVFPMVLAISPQMLLPQKNIKTVFVLTSVVDDDTSEELFRPPIA